MSSPHPVSETAAERSVSTSDWRRQLLRVWTRRCPRCGEKTLFATRFRLAEVCSHCELVYRREQGAMTGQMYLSAAVTEIVAAVWVVAVFLLTDWSVTTSLVVSLPLVVIFSFWFMPKATGLWVAIEYLTDLGNREPWV